MINSTFNIRIYAFLLDYLVIMIYGVFVLGTISFVFRPYVQFLFSSSSIVAELTGFLMITFPVSLYFILCECSKWQGTLGKRKMGICVVDNSGQRIGIGRSIVRTTVKFLPWELAHFTIWQLMLPSSMSDMIIYIILGIVYFAILVYLIIPFTNKKRKNVYDWIAGTEVVQCHK
ncbi:RDD family protein [Pseudogracilibacillus auburnensis]|uniref:Putative RDD family membrane protein YckC n=1 Tax=Pseudogracilibacillus auburnensis TaxID=1494959 RepID=A0A2V3W7W9_9BACI|nr:RDD family protein [Pseudogracilibacillus auburnensis]PXW90437.1 putative RDD family membrane protein YckC [Pseudogracilibacillus auburnensis]